MKKTIVIAIMIHKGGTGKTTTTTALADAFSNTGKKVLIVDADEQSNIKTVFGIKLQSSEGGLASILLDNVTPQSLTCKVRENIDVILSGGRFMRDFEKVHANTPDSELLMKKRFAGLDGYDLILIDTPPALSLISSNVVMYSDYVVMTCGPDLLSVVGVKNTINFIESLESRIKNVGNPVAKILGVIPTLHDGRRNIDISILDDLDNAENAGLFREGMVFNPIRNDIKVKTAQIKRKLLSETFPNSNAAQDYKQVSEQMWELLLNYNKRKTRRNPAAEPTQDASL